MRKLVLKPVDFECSIAECPPGLFLYSGIYVGMKSEYCTESGGVEAFCDSGEYYCGEEGKVIPIVARWEDE